MKTFSIAVTLGCLCLGSITTTNAAPADNKRAHQANITPCQLDINGYKGTGQGRIEVVENKEIHRCLGLLSGRPPIEQITIETEQCLVNIAENGFWDINCKLSV